MITSMNIYINNIRKEIEIKRSQMIKCADRWGVHSKEAIEKSQELDKLILEHQILTKN